MSKIQVQGVHHITFVGSNRETTIEFYQGVLGMPLVFEQPNLDVPEETHLYFDPGVGRLITFFVRPPRSVDPEPNLQGIGNVHSLALNVSHSVYSPVGPMPRVAVNFQRVDSEAAPSLAQAMGLDSPEEVLKRFEAGKRCYIGNVEGMLATYGWVTFDEELIGELGLRIRLAPGEAY